MSSNGPLIRLSFWAFALIGITLTMLISLVALAAFGIAALILAFIAVIGGFFWAFALA